MLENSHSYSGEKIPSITQTALNYQCCIFFMYLVESHYVSISIVINAAMVAKPDLYQQVIEIWAAVQRVV